MERDPAVYIMANGFHGTIYTGVTSNLLQRIHQHREGTLGSFTQTVGASGWCGLRCREECHPAREAAQKVAARVEA